MDATHRRSLPWAIGAYAVALVLVGVVMSESDRLPLPGWLTIGGFLLVQAVAGFVLGRWRWLLLGLAPLLPAIVAGQQADNPLIWFLTLIFVVPMAVAVTALGVIARKRYERRRPMARGRTLAIASVLPLSLALAIGFIDHNRTVRAERPHPVLLDERIGRIGSVGLGDSATRVEAHHGRAPSWTDSDSVEPLDASLDDLGSPSSIESPPGEHENFLRYPKYSFWIGTGRVYSIETIDRAVRTSRGVGVGDSIELIKRAYPELDCGEDSVGSDEPIPYPYCDGRTGPRTWIYFGGDYTKPGTPVTAITLLPHPFD